MITETQPKLMLHSEGLVKRYSRRTVVDDVSINVKQGEVVGLLGPNGDGNNILYDGWAGPSKCRKDLLE